MPGAYNSLREEHGYGSDHRNLGNRTVSYRGVQAVDTPQVTLWRFQLYGGIAFSGDPAAPNAVSTEVGAITGPPAATQTPPPVAASNSPTLSNRKGA